LRSHLNGIQAAVVDMARLLSWIKSGGESDRRCRNAGCLKFVD